MLMFEHSTLNSIIYHCSVVWKCKLCCELLYLVSVGITWKHVEPNWGCLRQPIKEDVLYLDKVASCDNSGDLNLEKFT